MKTEANFKNMTVEQVKDFIRENPFVSVEIAKNNEQDLNIIIHLFSNVLRDIER